MQLIPLARSDNVRKDVLNNNSNHRHQQKTPTHSNRSTPSKSPLHKPEVHTGWIKALMFRHIILFVAGISIIFARFNVMGSSAPVFQVVDNPHSFAPTVLFRVLNYSYIYAMNLWLLLNPWWLCFDWSMGCIPVIVSFMDYRIIFVLLFWLMFIAYIHMCLSQDNFNISRLGLISLALVVVPFLPACNLFFRVGFVIAERILYLPSIGYCIMLTLGISLLCSSFNKYRQMIGVLVLGVLFLFIWRSVKRSAQWKDEIVLFQSGEEVCPLNAKVHYNIAKMNSENNLNVDYAISKYRLAISLHPEYDQAMNNLANILKERGEVQEAESLLIQATTIRRDFAAAWMNLGIVQAAQNKTDLAEKSYLTAIRHRRKYPDCYYNLGNMYLDLNQHEDALMAWKNATMLKPGHLSAWVNMIIMVDNLGRLNDVRALTKEALVHLPKEAAIYYNAGNAFGKAGHYFDSEEYFLKATQLDPLNPHYFANLGVLYHRWGKLEQAEKTYLRALAIDPTMNSANDNLQMVRRKMQKSKPKL